MNRKFATHMRVMVILREVPSIQRDAPRVQLTVGIFVRPSCTCGHARTKMSAHMSAHTAEHCINTESMDLPA